MENKKVTFQDLMLQKINDIIDLDDKVKKGEVAEAEANKIKKRIDQIIRESKKLIREKNRVINKIEKGQIQYELAFKRVEKINKDLVSLVQEH